ncbi:MAG: hypothetical protein AB1Z98_08965 [Nannocystaceae bacterium]
MPATIASRSSDANPTGLPVARLRVTLRELEVLDPCIVDGDEGRWEIAAFVNGRALGDEFRTVVAQGGRVEIGLGIELDIDPNQGEDLVIELRMRNLVGPTMSGIDPPAVPSFHERLTYRSSPPWGVGSFAYSRAEVYVLRYAIEPRD